MNVEYFSGKTESRKCKITNRKNNKLEHELIDCEIMYFETIKSYTCFEVRINETNQKYLKYIYKKKEKKWKKKNVYSVRCALQTKILRMETEQTSSWTITKKLLIACKRRPRVTQQTRNYKCGALSFGMKYLQQAYYVLIYINSLLCFLLFCFLLCSVTFFDWRIKIYIENREMANHCQAVYFGECL